MENSLFRLVPGVVKCSKSISEEGIVRFQLDQAAEHLEIQLFVVLFANRAGVKEVTKDTDGHNAY